VQFGISTHLFHDKRLELAHLQQIADYGFETIELFATRTHFDYHSPAAAEQLREWLATTGLTLHSVHAPINESLIDGVWGTNYSLAAAEPKRRQLALQETRAALRLASTVPYRCLVLHLGVPDGYAAPGDNFRESAFRSVEELAADALDFNVKLALEVLPNDISTPLSLYRMLENDFDVPGVGACIDAGHAYLLGDVVDGIETLAGYVLTTHLHDNDGERDQHRVPFEGRINWEQTLLAFQKVGYDGVFLMELSNTGDPAKVLERARAARKRFEEILES
jgi:sugar phosphate isomerase/epimerase